EIETVTLNMRELEYISSAGLRVIVMLYKKITGTGGKLRLVNVNDMVMEIFTMTGMDSFLEIDKA
ncbi:MAG: STAS domain-containing protein, partial [Eubacterium sp.]